MQYQGRETKSMDFPKTNPNAAVAAVCEGTVAAEAAVEGDTMSSEARAE
jgi:hypothetical protein